MSHGESQDRDNPSGSDNIGGDTLNGLAKGNLESTRHSSSFRSSKPGKLSKQEVVVDEEEACDHIDENSVKGAVAPEPSRMKIIDVTQKKKEFILPNLQHHPVPLLTSKQKLLVRSHAFCGDDDTRLAVRYSSAPRLTTAARSTASSVSVESCQETYTDSTGIDLQSFISSTLHKNAKDRQMLLQLEQHMTTLVNDSTRHSQKFPAMSSYNRMLVHRVAAFFGLDHNVDQSGTAVVVNKTPQTRIPDVEFSSLIRGDVYTDEPRRHLRRDAQSYEEGRHCLIAEQLAGRRAHSFEVGECGVGSNVPVAHFALGRVPVHFMPQQDSASSADAASTHHHIESPGSCYSYGELPFMGIYSPSDGSLPYGSAAMHPWSSSDSYTSYSSSVELAPHVMSPALHSPNRPPLLTKCASIDIAPGLYKSASVQLNIADQRPSPGRRNLNERHRSEALAAREPSIPEHSTVPGAVSNENEESTAVTEPPVCYEISNAEPFHAAHYIVAPVPGQPYGTLPSYGRYVPANVATACSSVQGMVQQMDAFCLNDNAEVINSPMFAYQMPPSQQIGTVYPNQPYYLPVLPPGYVVASAPPQPIYRITPVQMQRSSFEYSMLTPSEDSRGVESLQTVPQMSSNTAEGL